MTEIADRRTMGKLRHRAAILDAARELIAERGGPRFSVDELAEQADVSRRTVFNHFASVDEILLALCTELLTGLSDGVIDHLTADAQGELTLTTLLDETESAVRSPDVARAISAIVTTLGGPGQSSRSESLKQLAFSRIAKEMVVGIGRLAGQEDPLEIEILFGSVMAGVTAVADRWVASTGATTRPAALTEWDRLVGLVFARLRSGYGR